MESANFGKQTLANIDINKMYGIIKNNKKDMPTYNISLNEDLSKIVDSQIKTGKFANRSEFFRQLIRFVFLSNKRNDISDFIYSEPYYSELKTRIKNIKGGKEKIISAKEFDKEFNF